MTLDLQTSFLNAMRQVPGAVAIIATLHEGERKGLAATAWTSLTAEPPTLLACINQFASAHPLILASRKFSINLLSSEHAETVAIFSGQRGLDGDARFASAAWSAGPQGLPVFDEAVASFECTLANHLDCGSHSVFTGRVATISSRAGVDALLYVNRGFARAAVIE